MAAEQGKRRTVEEEFTHQAGAFARADVFRAADTLDALVERLGPQRDQTWCDVACGPGIVACALAKRVRRVVGVDCTPAMLAAAAAEAGRQGIDNAAWLAGDALNLPLSQDACDGAVSRFALHHLTDPLAAVREMARIVKPGGKLAVADQCTDDRPETADWHQRIERWRDPSHESCLTPSGILALGAAAGLERVVWDQRPLELDYEEWLTRGSGGPGRRQDIAALLASPPPGAERIFARQGDRLRLLQVIVVWRRPDPSAAQPTQPPTQPPKEERP